MSGDRVIHRVGSGTAKIVIELDNGQTLVIPHLSVTELIISGDSFPDPSGINRFVATWPMTLLLSLEGVINNGPDGSAYTLNWAPTETVRQNAERLDVPKEIGPSK